MRLDDLKREMPGGGGGQKNPDVWVAPDGEVYPIGPGGILRDSLGNLGQVL